MSRRELGFRLMGQPVVIETDQEEVFEKLARAVTEGGEGPPGQPLAYTLDREGGEYAIWHQGQRLYATPHPDSLVITLISLMNYHLRRRLAGRVIAHAALVSLDGRGALLAGEKQAGKTTLVCRLMLDGFTIHADEYVVVGQEALSPFPRRLHVRQPTLALLPALAALAPCMQAFAPPAGRSYFFSPGQLGFAQTLAPARPALVVCLTPAHGSPSTLRKLPRWETARRVLAQVDNLSQTPGGEIQRLVETINRAACLELHLGDLDQAAALLRAALEGSSAEG